MSADPALRSLPYWESLEPVLAERERPAPGDPTRAGSVPRWRCRFSTRPCPYFKRMHEMTVDHVHEEIQLLAIDFSTMLFETMAPMPSWRDYYLSHDQRPATATCARSCRSCSGSGAATRWVLKSPQHLEQFPALVDTFPDATFVVTHRDPVSVTASMVTMLAYSLRLGADRGRSVAGVGRLLGVSGSSACCGAASTTATCCRPTRTIDVHFDEFMADDIAMVRRIYDLAGQPYTDDADAAMTSFMADHPRGRHGAVLYDLGQFGLDRALLRERLSFYVDHFGVSEEGG